MEKKKNIAESNYAKLKTHALLHKRPVQEVLQYYAMERFLYRLSLTSYKSLFFLKGGLMLKVWDPSTYRATVDIDLLAKANNSPENIENIFKEICSVMIDEDDGVRFDLNVFAITQTQLEMI